MSLHPILASAAERRLPPWALVGPKRVEHMARVSRLLGEWAEARKLPSEEVLRWRAAGTLHDVLRDADPEEIRSELPSALSDLPADVVHGPAAAARLRREGVRDEPFLRAVAFHTIGHPELDALGRAVYAADFLEPGRRGHREWRKELRARMFEDPESVVREVARARIVRRLEDSAPLRSETCAFWSVLAQEPRG